MQTQRAEWNQQQQALRRALTRADDHSQAMALCLRQHAAVHSAIGAQEMRWSFEDEAWLGVSDDIVRAIPAGSEHSIAWLVWHSTRIEDMTINALVAGTPEVIDAPLDAADLAALDDAVAWLNDAHSRNNQKEAGAGVGGSWLAALHAPLRDTGNTLNPAQIVHLSSVLNLAALRAYRRAVGRRTQQIITSLSPQDVRRPVAAPDLAGLVARGSVAANAEGLLAYWGSLTVAGLLLMPATRHPFVHWNEALQIRSRLMKQDIG